MSGKYALVIGNTQYTDPGLAKLTAPGKDARDFARVLETREICGFDDVQVLLDQPEPVVREAIEGFFDEKKPDDLLVLYFSGHGVRDEYGSLYLAVTNTNRLRLRATAIKSDFIRESMDQSRSRRQVLILDCCNSGAFAQGTKAETGGSIGTASAFEGTGYGRVVLTASDATQFAWEGDKVIGTVENSLFTHFLVKGLQGEADNDGDGRITIDELYDYAYGEIVNITPKQTPGKWSYKQQGEILLRQGIPSEDIKAVQLPADLVDETEDTRPYVREAAVQKLAKILQGRNIGLARSASEALEKIAADENTTRRVALAATQALQAYRQAEQKRAAEQATIAEAATALAEERRRTTEDALAKLRGREVTQQISTLDAERARKNKQGTPNGLSKLPWRAIAISGAAIVAVIALGYAAIKYIPRGGEPTVQASAVDTPAGGNAGGTNGAPLVLQTEAAVYGLAYSPDGRMLASAGSDKNITLWDTATNQKLGEPLSGHSDTVHTVAFSPDGKTLASGSWDNTVILWDIASHKAISQPLEGHTDSVYSVAFSPDGKILAAGSKDKTIILWDVATRQPIGQPLKGHTGWVNSIAFSTDGKMLASGSDDDTIIFWDVATRQPVSGPLRGTPHTIYALAFSPDGKTLASGSGDNIVSFWDVETRQRIGNPLQGHTDAVNTVAFSPDGKMLASGSQDNTVILWDVERRQPIGKPLTGYSQPVHTVAFSPDGKTLATGSDDNFMLLWDVVGLHGTSATTQQSPAQALNETPAAGTPSGENTSGLAAVQATVPTPTRLPATWYLTSLKAQVLSLTFFEMGSDTPPVSERLYKDRFKASETRFIAYQLNLTFPPPGQKVNFTIRATYTNLGTGRVWADFSVDRFVLSDWTNSYHDANWGDKDYGWWQTGTYRVDLYVGGDKIASGTFEVY